MKKLFAVALTVIFTAIFCFSQDVKEQEQILDFSPIVNPIKEPEKPKKIEGVDPGKYFNNLKSAYSPIVVKESDLGKYAGKDLSESSVKRVLEGDKTLDAEFALTQSEEDKKNGYLIFGLLGIGAIFIFTYFAFSNGQTKDNQNAIGMKKEDKTNNGCIFL